MENKLLNFDYCGSIIPFIFNGNDYMINATEMAKSVCKTKAEYNAKNPSHWLRSKEAQEYIQALSDARNLDITQLIVTAKGGSMGGVRGGTWTHEYIALYYSKWLDPKLSLGLNKFLINTRIGNSPERITSYNREFVLEYLLDLIDILGLQMKESDKIEIVNDGQGTTKFILGSHIEFTKNSLLSTVLRECDYDFTLKTINMLFKNFIEKSDKDLIIYSYYALPTILGSLSYSKVSRSNIQKTYLMKDSNTGYTKIGKAINPKFRERTLQSEKPSISLFAVCETQVESELHNKYKDKRIRGEWFNLSTKEIDEILDMYKFVEILSEDERNQVSTGFGV